MSRKLPSLTSQTFVRFLLRQGFCRERQVGSHLTLKHPDGRIVTVPVHTGTDIGKGLAKRILNDAGYSSEEFYRLR